VKSFEEAFATVCRFVDERDPEAQAKLAEADARIRKTVDRFKTIFCEDVNPNSDFNHYIAMLAQKIMRGDYVSFVIDLKFLFMNGVVVGIEMEKRDDL
jgi:hypothetical protein